MTASPTLRLAALALTALLTPLFAAAADGTVVVEWDAGAFANGAVKPTTGTGVLRGVGTVEPLGDHRLLTLAAGQELTLTLAAGPLATASPVALEIGIAPRVAPTAYHGGLIEAGDYQKSGLRILLQHDLRVSVEHWTGGEPTYLVSPSSIPLGMLSTIRYEHDGAMARLLIDGKMVAQANCAPAAAWTGTVHIGIASGPSYFYDGGIGRIRILALESAAATR